ncbi:MAG: hypothetical protein K5905_31325 [Roseibium sp.]|uniref:hypothetical protein n=1 Tax=Roseibium sp. TaxID=1936156 RepID=UPI002629162C|nr:hypothetical protein [Roseibium sp.]MCV0429949.1 hypothetical protein [Roseibium sp.]
MTLQQNSKATTGVLREFRQDPSLMLALGTGSLLTAFLATVHACCIGLATPDHFAALLQICSTAG